MIQEWKMPDLATNDAPIRVVRWIVRPGDVVTRGQPLLEAETDKATIEVESPVNGKLDRVLCQADDEVSVGQAIALFDIAEAAPTQPTATAAPATSMAPIVPPEATVPIAALSAGSGADERTTGKPIGMFARNRAALTKKDVPLPGIRLSAAQRTAALRLQSSKQTIPHFYVQTSFNASAIVARRAAAQPLTLAWDAFYVRAVARAISRFDRFRCRFDGEWLVPADCEAIGVAIAVDSDLYLLPLLAPAGKTVEQISQELGQGVERLRSGDQEIRRLPSTLMTVTNLGSCNVESFVPIINPPEAAVLGAGKVKLAPVALDDGQLVAQYRGMLTLSVDHRVANGKYAAEFLDAVVQELETP